MARRVFFSFHFERDIFRANVVRNSWVTKPDREAAGFWDASLWEEAKTDGEEALKQLINDGLQGTSVTTVLIGAKTAGRQWVNYEIEQSLNRGNGLVGIYIHHIKDLDGNTDSKGANPLDDWEFTYDGERRRASDVFNTYDWVNNDGYTNFGDWVEAAAKKVGK